MTERPTGPDVFEAAARLRAALDDGPAFGEQRTVVWRSDLAAVLDARRDHSLSDAAVRRALTAWNTTWPRRAVLTHQPPAQKAMRAAITAALQLDPPTTTEETP